MLDKCYKILPKMTYAPSQRTVQSPGLPPSCGGSCWSEPFPQHSPEGIVPFVASPSVPASCEHPMKGVKREGAMEGEMEGGGSNGRREGGRGGRKGSEDREGGKEGGMPM